MIRHSNRGINVFLAVLGLLACSSVVRADNWPSFRGANGRGIGDGDPPIKWDVSKGEHVKWKTLIPGIAHASPIIWDDYVFVTTAVSQATKAPPVKTGWLDGTGDSASDTGAWTWKVICLDRKTGSIIWQKDACSGVPKMKRHIKATHANCTPATDGKHVVAFFGSEGLYCYDMHGELLWKKDLGVFKSGPQGLEWGFAGSPIIHDGKVVVQCDAANTSFWASFDVKTGRELVRVKANDTTTWSTPSIAESGGHAQVVCNGWKRIAGYDLESGKELWHLAGGGDCPVPTPQVVEDSIFITNGHGQSPIYAIRTKARGDLTPSEDKLPKDLSWWQPRNGSYMPTPLVLGKTLYVGGDNAALAAYDADTGKLHYRRRIRSGGQFSGSLVAAADRLYFANEAGDVFVIKAGESYELLAKNSMNEVCMATPAIAKGCLFIRTQDNLYCIGQ